MANVKFTASQARTINLYKNSRSKLLKCANIYFNEQCLVKKKVIPKYANLKFTNNSPYMFIYVLNTSGWQTLNLHAKLIAHTTATIK